MDRTLTIVPRAVEDLQRRANVTLASGTLDIKIVVTKLTPGQANSPSGCSPSCIAPFAACLLPWGHLR
jgi:hypothetical protein